jgi:DNA-binding XRE family transcriptional regulator
MKARQLYNRIGLLRQEKGISRKELAAAIGVNYQTVGYLEREEYSPSLDLALRICEYFDLPVEMVFSTEPLPPLSREVLDLRRDRGDEK